MKSRSSSHRVFAGLLRLALALVSLVLVGGCSAEEAPGKGETTVDVLRPITLTAVARFPENDPAFMGVDVKPDRLIFAYTPRPAQALSTGDVLSGVRGGGYLRRVVEVHRLNDGRLEATTENAHLTDLILDGHFRARVTPEPGHWQAASEVGTAAQALTVCPDGASCLPGTAVSLFPEHAEPLTCTATPSATGSASVLPAFTATLQTVFEIDIRPQVQWLSVRLGALHRASFRVDGQVRMGAQIATEGPGSASCDIDVAEALHLPSFEFPCIIGVGPIPVAALLTVAPKLRIEAKAESTASFSWSGTVAYGFAAGVDFYEGAWHPVWETLSDVSVEKQIDGDVAAEVKVVAGVESSFALFGLAGPTLSLGLFADGTVQAGADGCGYRVTGGLDGSIGVEAEIKVGDLIDITLLEVEYPLQLVTKQLASGPCSPCPADAPMWNPDTMRCESCPDETPTWDPASQLCTGECPGGADSGGDAPVTRAFELGAKKGTIVLSHDRQNKPDQIIVTYEGATIYDSECGGDPNGPAEVSISYAGSSTQVVVEVLPNCTGGTGTAWTFSVSCPEPAPTPEWPDTVILVHGWARGWKEQVKALAGTIDYRDFWYWSGAEKELKAAAEEDGHTLEVIAANWDGVSALNVATHTLEEVLDCFCTGPSTCELVGHSTGDALIGYTLDRAKEERPDKSHTLCAYNPTQKGWNIKAVYVAGGVGGGSELSFGGQLLYDDPIVPELDPKVMRSLYNHNMHGWYTAVPNIRFVGAGHNTNAYRATALLLPGDDDGAVPFHSQGGVSVYDGTGADDGARDAYCVLRHSGYGLSCGQLNLGVAPAQQWGHITYTNVPLFAGFRVAMIDDARLYDHTDEIANVAEWIKRYKRTKTPWRTSEP